MKLLYIDLFCGAGGTSTGVEDSHINDARCAKVIACVNHDANAIASHQANHSDGTRTLLFAWSLLIDGLLLNGF